MVIGMYTVKEVAEVLKLTEETIREYLRRGKIKGKKIGNQWRVTQESLNDYLKEG